MNLFSVIDFHCDLLYYLAQHPLRTPHDLDAKCSLPQLAKGGVTTQIFAVFTKTAPFATLSGLRQVDLFDTLCSACSSKSLDSVQEKALVPLYAFENASGFCIDEEPLDRGIHRFWSICERVGTPVYIGLTWNSENRFGGGALTEKGLKEDGKFFLKQLHGKKIAIDLSHASDALAYDILNTIDQNNLEIPLLASHSNARSIMNVPRNLPDELAKELFRREGVIGLNFYMGFVGPSEHSFAQHIAHWLDMGGEDHVVFGADFFYGMDLSTDANGKRENDFFDSCPDSASYSYLLQLLQRDLQVSDSFIQKLAHKNAERFLCHLQK